MDIAELRTKLDNIAAELAEQDVQQEEVAIEEHHEKDEDGNIIEHPIEDEPVEESVEELSEFSPDNMAAAKKDTKAIQKSGSGMKSTSAAKPQAAGTLAKRLNNDVNEEEVAEEEAVEEAVVEVPVQELADIMQLAGYTDYAERIQEYANEPEEDYGSVEDQMIGLSGGLNGPKSSYPAAAGGDNAMAQEPTEIEEDSMANVEEKLYKSYKDFLEEAEIKEETE